MRGEVAKYEQVLKLCCVKREEGGPGSQLTELVTGTVSRGPRGFMVVGVQSFEGLLQIPGEWKSPTFPRCNWNVGSLPCSWSVKLPKLIQIHNHTSLLILRSSWTFSVTSTVNFSSRFKARYLENFGELFHF